MQDFSWIQPGACAWDSWWTGTNPFDSDPRHRGVDSRGTTPSHKEYIDFAAEMGWPYQLMDWYWYHGMTSYNKSLHSNPNPMRADFKQSVPDINVPELVQYAKSKNVRLLIWAHSLDIETFGVEDALSYLADQGFAGVKIDFLNSQSQETVQWCEKVLATAAKHHLLIDFHGTYKPTGLARTYPNFITQEGVLGNEYNKLPGKLLGQKSESNTSSGRKPNSQPIMTIKTFLKAMAVFPRWVAVRTFGWHRHCEQLQRGRAHVSAELPLLLLLPAQVRNSLIATACAVLGACVFFMSGLSIITCLL